MASWYDLFTLVLTISAFVGAVLGVRFVAARIRAAVDSTKESLKSKGLTISDKGVSVRTSSHLSREDYVDATQRGFMRAMNVAGFSKSNNIGDDPVDSPGSGPGSGSPPKPAEMARHESNSSLHSNGSMDTADEKEPKRRHFRLRKGARA
ncbi:hypothetical protein M0805_007646 [Coniferiporia weirii]|nr:hypothetical protein M0805_007646 [Coniferiporia weirii]